MTPVLNFRLKFLFGRRLFFQK